MTDNDHLLIRIDERVAAILARLESGDARFANHSKRIGALERWRSWILGALAVLGALLGWRLVP